MFAMYVESYFGGRQFRGDSKLSETFKFEISEGILHSFKLPCIFPNQLCIFVKGFREKSMSGRCTSLRNTLCKIFYSAWILFKDETDFYASLLVLNNFCLSVILFKGRTKAYLCNAYLHLWNYFSLLQTIFVWLRFLSKAELKLY